MPEVEPIEDAYAGFFKTWADAMATPSDLFWSVLETEARRRCHQIGLQPTDDNTEGNIAPRTVNCMLKAAEDEGKEMATRPGMMRKGESEEGCSPRRPRLVLVAADAEDVPSSIVAELLSAA